MNEWGFIGQDMFVGIGKFTTSIKFKQRCGLALLGNTLLSNSHAS